MAERGPIALVGGSEFMSPARLLDAWLLERSGGTDVLVLPTAAARSRPDMAVDTARGHFEKIGGRVQPVMVLDRQSAGDPAIAEPGHAHIPKGGPRR